MATSDVQDLINRYAGDIGPTEGSKLTAGRLTPQSWDKYKNGKARHLRMPTDDTMMGLTDALGFDDDLVVMQAFARSGGRLRIKATPLLLTELNVAGVGVFDSYPDLVTAESARFRMLARALVDLRAACGIDPPH